MLRAPKKNYLTATTVIARSIAGTIAVLAAIMYLPKRENVFEQNKFKTTARN
jgi:hypothetical protein